MPRRPVYPLGKGDSWMATIIECTEGHYEARKASYGATHPWDEEYREWRKQRDECDCLEWRVIE